VSTTQLVRFVAKPLAFAAALAPVAWIIWAFQTGALSANPLSDVTNETGVWTLRFVCLTLAITPLRRLTGWNLVIRFRRMIGLFAFFYGSLHFLTYVIADRFASLVDFPDGIVAWSTARNLLAAIAEDVYKRPYITVGFTAFVLMVPLAVTSTAGWIRRLGGKQWQTLHRLIYATAVGGVLHYWWLVKADVSRPAVYAFVVGLLLAFRIYWSRFRTAAPGARTPAPRTVPSRPAASGTSTS
jgi:sulfoxide reductase heme-binding subunit YedZ